MSAGGAGPDFAGGSSGFFDGSGGFAIASGAGGFSNTGGFTSTGGFTNALGTGGVSTGTGSDAGAFNPLLCNFTGTWATFGQVPVTWPATIAIIASQGTLNQWVLSRETQATPGGSVTASSVPCGITTPDFQTNIFGGASAFGIRFPDTIFDSGNIPPTAFTISVTITPSGFGFTTNPFAYLIGLTLDNAATAQWPGTASVNEVDEDKDQNPGVTIIPATGPGYSYPPTSIPFPGTPLADQLYLAQRTVMSLSGTLTSCDELDGAVTIAAPGGVAAIDSSIIGCHVQGGTTCTSSQSGFIDENRPVFTPSGPGKMISVRMPDNATCADVRTRLPAP